MFLSEIIQDALDDLASTHTSTARKGRALNNLEKLMVDICVPSDEETLKFFITLQDTFQCNVPSRLLAWVSETTCRLEVLTEKGSPDGEKEMEVAIISSQLIQALSIIQGVALNHWGSKQYLGRRYALEVLLDLFLTSRHVSPTTTSKALNISSANRSTQRDDKSSKGPPPLALASAVLDTLLCILVDSSPALRAFEDTNGVQYVVRILKRAGTPREVRMKCLEFLYFYLMDESANPVDIGAQLDLLGVSELPTAPNSPVKSNFRSATGGSSASSSSSSTSSSLSSGSSLASQSTSATSVSSASFSSSCFNGSSTPIEEQSPSKPLSAVPNLTPSSSRVVTPPQPRSLLMLRKEVEFVPLSPKKASAAKLGLGSPRVLSKQREGRSSEDMERESSSRISRSIIEQTPKRTTPQRLGLAQSTPQLGDHRPEVAAFKRGHRRGQSSLDIRLPSVSAPPDPRAVGTRTMEEKKEILGSMLGNVDALVEGVRKAGIWGLG